MKKYNHLDQIVEMLPDHIRASFRDYILTGRASDEYKQFQEEYPKITTESEKYVLDLISSVLKERK